MISRLGSVKHLARLASFCNSQAGALPPTLVFPHCGVGRLRHLNHWTRGSYVCGRDPNTTRPPLQPDRSLLQMRHLHSVQIRMDFRH